MESERMQESKKNQATPPGGPVSLDQASLQAALVAAGFSRLLPQMDALVQPSIRLATTAAHESALPLGASKVGGQPDLPADVEWPVWKGLPQSFLAQVRLTDLQPLLQGRLAGALPAQGMLWFYYDAQQETYGETQADQGGWQVLYLRDAQPALQRRQPPAALPKDGRFRACLVRFSAELTVATQPPLEIAGLGWSDADQERYDALLAQVVPPPGTAPRHRLLGFPDTIQDDMRLQCELASRGIADADDPRVEALAPQANAWRLLLQLDSDAQAGMRWASSGMLYYWLRRDAWEARARGPKAQHLEESWLVVQSE
jgi:uncharacterized protein YwqG